MTNSVSDEELMLQVKDGQRNSLGLLFDRYQVPLFNFYFKLTGNRVASEDLVQEVFLRILKYRQSYRPGTIFRTWMYQIARNTRLTHLRKEVTTVGWDVKEHSPLVLPADTVEQSEKIRLLYGALRRMHEDKRELLILSRFQDLKHEEIAQLYGCRVGTVRVKIHRALQELREQFQKLDGSPCAPVDRCSKSVRPLLAAGGGS